MKKIKFLIPLVLMGLTTTSCNNYLDINENPNSVPAENILPSLALPGAISEIYRTQGTDMMKLGNLMMNNWACNVYSFGETFSTENTLNLNSSSYSGIWDNIYLNLNTFNFIENFPNPDHKQDNYIAISKVMKAFYMQYIVDLYGDAPYSEAFKGQANLHPKYDNDETIYKSSIENLNAAIAIIDAANPVAEAADASDIVFEGDMDLWRQFANTVKLRYLIRMSNVTGSMATFRDQELAKLSAEAAVLGWDNVFINQTVSENPGYSSANNDSMHPFVVSYFATSAGVRPSNFGTVTISEHLANTLEGNTILNSTEPYYAKFNNVSDPRKYRQFTRISYSFNGQSFNRLKGVRQGATAGQPGAPQDPNSPSSRNVSQLANGNFIGGATSGSLIQLSNDRGGVMMTAAESSFLQAEAALRWPSLFSYNAQTKFTKGITDSFTYYGAASGSYLADIASKAGLGWTGSDAQKLEAIMTQKWISTVNATPTEAYIEYSRTGYPFIPLAVTAAQARKPYRLQYPTSEYSANPSNVPSLSTAQLFTKNSSTPFWNQN
ncbi:SusD/RagB family nutrient-binding outer membrane lipoprotein [Chryseobacterium tongliaoense]|uniref:SusD/RagB family nutrient-binding outer membrane lipoprotein n=1 Tax=Chryseobacterium tongliaoense TaxID=3240933 RepID=UPI0035144916